MPTIVLRTNLDQASPLLIPDLGILIPAAGGTETFTDAFNVQDVRESLDVRALTNDSAYVGGTDASDHSLILNDGVNDIPPDEVDLFLTPSPGNSSSPTFIRSYTGGVSLRDVVYQKSDGTVDRADASAVATGIPVGIVESIDNPVSGKCVVRFGGDLTGFTGLTPGEIYILSSSPGLIVGETDTGNIIYPDTTPDSGHVIVEVGIAGNATTLLVRTTQDFEQM